MRLFKRYPSRSVSWSAVAAAAVAAVGVAMAAPTQASALTYTVRNDNDSGLDSLRQAIDDANANPNGANPDRIEFNVPGVGGHLITLASDLPPITDPVKVLGYTQPGSVVGSVGVPATVKIIVDASQAQNGLVLQTDDSRVSGLEIRSAGSAVGAATPDGVGIRVEGSRNHIDGNYIGTEQFASFPYFQWGTTGDGVQITGDNNHVGSEAADDRNVIAASGLFAGNGTADGVSIVGDRNTVKGNTIGTDDLGANDQMGNTGAGVRIAGTGNQVGSPADGAGNQLSNNDDGGVVIASGTSNVVDGNLIGTNADGTAEVGNGAGGVIGEETGGAGNVIAGSTFGAGLQLHGNHNTAEHNTIGTNAAGTEALANFGGVQISGNNNLVGGQFVDNGNVVSGNHLYGILIHDPGDLTHRPFGNRIEGNHIGTDINGAVTVILPNEGDGVQIIDADFNTIGGIGEDNGKSNLIANNEGAGVSVASGIRNPILQNRIFDNLGLGIDLSADGAVNPNDAGDADAGPNGLQNFPLVTAATTVGSVTTVDWSALDFGSDPLASTELDFYAGDTCDPSGNGEGETFVGSATFAAAGGGLPTSGTTTMNVPVAAGQFITATASVGFGVPLLPGRTSEFSPCVKV